MNKQNIEDCIERLELIINYADDVMTRFKQELRHIEKEQDAVAKEKE